MGRFRHKNVICITSVQPPNLRTTQPHSRCHNSSKILQSHSQIESLCHHHNFLEQLRTSEHMQQPDHAFAERFDDDMIQIGHHAASQCKRKKTLGMKPPISTSMGVHTFLQDSLIKLTQWAGPEYSNTTNYRPLPLGAQYHPRRYTKILKRFNKMLQQHKLPILRKWLTNIKIVAKKKRQQSLVTFDRQKKTSGCFGN